MTTSTSVRVLRHGVKSSAVEGPALGKGVEDNRNQFLRLFPSTEESESPRLKGAPRSAQGNALGNHDIQSLCCLVWGT